MKKIELLAPAGNKEAFVAAINNGADAIYIGGKQFSARAFANNFADEEIVELIKYAHKMNVKVYVGINIEIYEEELDNVISYIDMLYLNDVDALIVADLGLISLISNRYPDLRIHASTQLNTNNLWQIKLLEQLNVKRVVLARETSLSTIQYIIKNTSMEIEVFAHGALCVCYSGNCLHSSMIGKRSGNRGMCAQPCRMSYTLLENGKAISNKKYLLSMKDLNTLENIDKLINSNITSLKIEGRMKSATYVGLVTKSYREAIDRYYQTGKNIIDKTINDKLVQTFSRMFTKGYIFNESNKDITNTFRPNHIGIKIGKVVGFEKGNVQIKLEQEVKQQDKIAIINKTYEDVNMYLSKIYVRNKLTNMGYKNEVIQIPLTSQVNKDALVFKMVDYELEKEIEQDNQASKLIPLRFKVVANVNENLVISVKDDRNNYFVETSPYIVEKAINLPTSNEKIIEQLERVKGSNYYVLKAEIASDHQGIIPAKYVNDLRRILIEKIDIAREKNYDRDVKNILPITYLPIPTKTNLFSLKVKVNNLNQLDAIASFKQIAAIYYNDAKTFNEAKNKYPKLNIILCEKRIHNDKSKYDMDTSAYVINNYGDLIKHSGARLISDAYLNVTNTATIAKLLELNCQSITLSNELSFKQIKEIIESFKNKYGYLPPLEMIVYGKIQTMITKHCFIAKEKGFERKNCMSCHKNTYQLLDRMGYKFDIMTDEDCNVTILNSKTLHLIDYLNQIKEIGLSAIRLDFTTEGSNTIKEIVQAYIDKLNDNQYNLELYDVTYGYFLD